MFKFTDLSDNDEFKAEDYRLNPKDFYEKRRTSRRPYVFDLRSANDYEESHLPGSHNLPIEHFENSIYQMPFSGDILLYGEKTVKFLPQPKFSMTMDSIPSILSIPTTPFSTRSMILT